MARGKGRGGYQRPNNPAAVSGPGALSQRTDGGPADRQPLRAPTGMPYGENQALLDQQRAAPLAAGAPSTPASQQGAPAGGAPINPAEFDAFRPTDRPGEPVTAGVPLGPGPSSVATAGDAAEEFLTALYQQFPHPHILRLLERARRG